MRALCGCVGAPTRSLIASFQINTSFSTVTQIGILLVKHGSGTRGCGAGSEGMIVVLTLWRSLAAGYKNPEEDWVCDGEIRAEMYLVE